MIGLYLVFGFSLLFTLSFDTHAGKPLTTMYWLYMVVSGFSAILEAGYVVSGVESKTLKIFRVTFIACTFAYMAMQLWFTFTL